MPEFRGKKIDNSRFRDSGSVSKWRSLTLNRTLVDDDGIALLIDVASKLEEVHIASDLITDRSMPVLCALPKLVSLLLECVPRVTDAGIAHVSQMEQLRELYLNGTQLTDDGVDALLCLANVRCLSLRRTKVTDAGVSKLHAFMNLRSVALDGTMIRGHGLETLLDVERMGLYVEHCPIVDDGLRPYLESHRRYETLSLSHTLITDASLPAIAENRMMADLRLENTAVTNLEMQSLCGHPSLKYLYLAQTQVSEAMCARLRTESPKDLVVYR